MQNKKNGRRQFLVLKGISPELDLGQKGVRCLNLKVLGGIGGVNLICLTRWDIPNSAPPVESFHSLYTQRKKGYQNSAPGVLLLQIS